MTGRSRSLSLQISFCYFGKSVESSAIINCQLSENLTVNLNAGVLQAMNHGAVRKAIHAGCCINAGNPQFAEIAFFLAAMSKGIIH